MKDNLSITLFTLITIFLAASCGKHSPSLEIAVYTDSILSDVSHHPVGINLDYFTDDDNYLKPARGTADALKAMGVKYLRYPGGNKSDFYFFSVPPYEESIPTLARTGKGAVGGRDRLLHNYSDFAVDVLDFDEFITMCREINAEPVLCVAADEYLADYPEGTTWSTREELIAHAVEWVRYANIKNGYNVKYWMIGNESWHRSNPNSSAEIYAQDVIDFSKAMKSVDSTIFIIPNGNSEDFWKVVLEQAGEFIDYLCISNYPIWQFWEGYASYRDTIQNLTGPVERTLRALDQAGRKDDLEVIIAEYGPFDWASTVSGDHDQSKAWPMINDMGHAICNFEMTGHQLLIPEVEFSQFWNTRWINNDSVEHSAYDALDRNGNFNAIGYSLMIWGNYLGDYMVKTTGTTHLRSFASYSPGNQRLFVYLLNMVDEEQQVDLVFDLPGELEVTFAGELVGEGPDDMEPVWQEFKTVNDPSSISVKGTSITVVAYHIIEDPS
jgi:hypothetical protein